MIIYKTEEEIRAMRESSQIVAKILAELEHMIKPGLRTSELDDCAEQKASCHAQRGGNSRRSNEQARECNERDDGDPAPTK